MNRMTALVAYTQLKQQRIHLNKLCSATFEVRSNIFEQLWSNLWLSEQLMRTLGIDISYKNHILKEKSISVKNIDA